MLRVIIVLSTVVYVHSLEANNCQYNTTDGILDLRTFGDPDKPKYSDIPDADATSTRRYSFNGCFSYSTTGGCKNAAACMTDSVTKTSTTIARQAYRNFTYNLGLSQLIYTDGASMTLRVFLLCDPTETIRAGLVGGNNYYVNINSPCACAGKCKYTPPPSGLSGGAIFVIFVICVAATYLLVGILFLRCVKQHQGLDMIPHRTFWIQVKNDSLGGARFLASKVTGRSNLYEKV